MDHNPSSSSPQGEEGGHEMEEGEPLIEQQQVVGGQTVDHQFPKTMDLMGEEFVPRLKSEPEDLPRRVQQVTRPSVVINAAALEASSPTVTSSVAEQGGNLVYCNLSDLEFNSAVGGGGESVVAYTSLGGGGLQEVTMTNSNPGFLQMVGAGGLQLATSQERNPYSAVSTILLQGGILQLKSEPSSVPGTSIVTQGEHQGQSLPTQGEHQGQSLPLENKQQRMLPGAQVVTVGGGGTSGSRPQDAIASILASMNQATTQVVTTAEQASVVSLASPVDYSTTVQEVVNVVDQLGEGQEMVPLNLATGAQQVSTIQGPQQIQVQGIKRIAQQGAGGGVVTKKVIIATINGTQRILTPVSSPQMIAVKSTPRLMPDGTLSTTGTPLTIIQQKPVPVISAPRPKPVPVNTSPSATAVKSVDNKTCRWKFENGQICGKVFTKTYNLTVHMRMHQDIRPFPCTICEQTFRQKAHLQRHEATHGIDTSQGRKRRKKSMLDGMGMDSGMIVGGPDSDRRMSESEEEEAAVGSEGEVIYRPFIDHKRPRFSVGTDMKTETSNLDLDPMIEPIDGATATVQVKKHCPITVGTNTDITPDVRDTFVDDLEEDMEPVRYRTSTTGTTMQVEQGVQYCEADLLEQQPESKFVPISKVVSAIDAPQVAAMQTQVSMSELMGEGGVTLLPGDKVMKVEGGEVTYSSQQQYVTQGDECGEYIEQVEGADTTHLIASDGSFIDASTNQIVMTGDGSLVNLVSVHEAEPEPQENVVNIVTSTATNEQGQQIVIIENLDQHSPELQREIMNALLADNTLVPISQT